MGCMKWLNGALHRSRTNTRSLSENRHFFSNRGIKKKRRHIVNIPRVVFFKNDELGRKGILG